MKSKIIKDWKRQLKSYSFLSMVANILIAVSYGLSLAFGMSLVTLSTKAVVMVMGGVALMGAIGRFIKQTQEDEEHDKDS
jgi:hypothetical protein